MTYLAIYLAAISLLAVILTVYDNDDRFSRMLSTYEGEQAALTGDTASLRAEISAEQEKADSIEKFLKLCETYTDFTELAADIVRTSVEKIVVHEAIKAPGHRYKKLSQEIDIYFTFIGEGPQTQPAPAAALPGTPP